MDEEARIITLAGLKEGYLNERYIHLKDNSLEIDENIMHLDILNFKIRNKIYQNRLALKVEMINNGINVVSSRWDYYSDKLAGNTEAKISPKDICIEYDALVKSNRFGNNIERMNLIAKERPILIEAYYALGLEKMVELKFNQTNIKRHMIKQSDIPQKGKIKEMMLERIGILKSIEVSKAKDIIADIYSFLGVKKTAKATDLNEYFICKEYIKKCNGKSVKYFEIIKERIIAHE